MRVRLVLILALIAVVSAKLTIHTLPVKRESALSISEFEREYAGASEPRPVVLEGYAKSWDAMGWSLEVFKEKCGTRELARPCQGRDDVLRVYNESLGEEQWAGMQGINPGTLGMKTVADYVASAKGEELYLHDVAIDSLCPALLKDFPSPKYFQLDFQKHFPDKLRSRHKCPDSKNGGPTHPSLFVGAPNSVTGLHIDSRATRFWMALFSGTKTFRLVNPRKKARIISKATGLCSGDLFATPVAESASANSFEVFEATLAAGDVIFIPEGWPHQVKNGPERTFAVSYNYIDLATRDAHIDYMENSRRLIEFGTTDQTLASLQLAWMRHHKHFPLVSSNYAEGDVPWSHFFAIQRANMSEDTLFDQASKDEELAITNILAKPGEEITMPDGAPPLDELLNSDNSEKNSPAEPGGSSILDAYDNDDDDDDELSSDTSKLDGTTGDKHWSDDL